MTAQTRPLTPPRHILHGDRLDKDLTLSGDVAIVGTGAGGGVAAEILSQAGLKVVLIEEGGYYTAKDFHPMREAVAYPTLYQEIASRKTKDKGVTILQGRAVGGSTTVNWTTCFRTPPETLDHWSQAHGLKGSSEAEMAPWFERMEKRLNIAPWDGRNPNNDVLYRGATKLGWHAGAISRNVRHCRNLGYCGTGCPVDAKQSMLVTTVPAALDHGASLLVRVRAETLEIQGDRVTGIHGVALDATGANATGVRVRVEAPTIVAAGGGINTPALLLRSRAPDPYALVGQRTFLHVVNASAAVMPERVAPFDGAPQSSYSNEFLWRDGVTGRIGYKLEVAPLHPVLASTMHKGYGQAHAQMMAQLPHLNGMIALLRDGFNEQSQGGRVTLGKDGSPVLDYPMNDYLWEGVRHAYLSMAECQFAAGAAAVMPMHVDTPSYRSWGEAQKAIAELPLAINRALLFSAHVMGGCPMGEDPRRAAVDSLGKHHQLANLWVIDGSTFPTSIGANPSLPIYAMAARQASALAERLRGRKAGTG